jgi:hypothetical protein
MRKSNCETDEPELKPVDGVQHLAACHYSNELMERDLTPDEIFAVTAADEANVPVEAETPGPQSAAS